MERGATQMSFVESGDWKREDTRPDHEAVPVSPTLHWRLTFVGRRRVQSVWLDHSLNIGRAPEAHIVLDDSAVSRLHATIDFRRPEQPTIVDRDSRNGLWVQGVRVPHAALSPGAAIRLGRHWLLVERGVRDNVRAGQSLAAAALDRALYRAVAAQLPVLMLGPTGVGKSHHALQLVARARPTDPLVSLNCAELSPTLVEAELFGAEKGAYTGANQARPGLFEQADGGVLFLDEVGTLSPDLQAKLLHVLETGRVRRVGSTRWRTVKFALMAATNLDLKQAVMSGAFREDLYHRLAGHVIEIPALTERRVDLPTLVNTLQPDAGWHELSVAQQRHVLNHPWPGNIRELRYWLRGSSSQAPMPVELTSEEAADPDSIRRPTPASSRVVDTITQPALAVGETGHPPTSGAVPVYLPYRAASHSTPDPAADSVDSPGPNPVDTSTGPIETVPLEKIDPAEASTPLSATLRRRRPGPRADIPDASELNQLLAQHGGNVTAVARALGKGPTQIRRWLGLS
jgi:DNA-binding NtrC family response regulator